MWIIRQRWEKLYFAHFCGPAELVRRALPPELELDLWQGEAVLSVVPFRMCRVRFPFLPPLPVVSSLWEYNLRTYVRRNGRAGIYFFTLESDNVLANWIARTVFGLPYRNSALKVRQKGNSLDLTQRRGDLHSEISLSHHSSPPKHPEFEIWSTERYCLFNVRQGQVVRGDVNHQPWKLKSARLEKWEGNFLDLVPSAAANFRFLSASYCEQIDVSFAPFEKIP